MTRRPVDSLFSTDEWTEVLGRPLNEEEMVLLGTPGGEATLIQQQAARGYPALVIVPDVPTLPRYPGRILRHLDPSPLDAFGVEKVYSCVKLNDNGSYLVYGRWYGGHTQFVAYRVTWQPSNQDKWVSLPVSELQMAIVSAAVTQRAAAMLSQRSWLEAISEIDDAGERLEELRALMDEGPNLLKVSSNFGSKGEAIVNFQGLAGLPAYDVYWRRDGDQFVVVSVDDPPNPSSAIERVQGVLGRPRRTLNSEVLADLVIIELCGLVMGRFSQTAV